MGDDKTKTISAAPRELQLSALLSRTDGQQSTQKFVFFFLYHIIFTLNPPSCEPSTPFSRERKTMVFHSFTTYFSRDWVGAQAASQTAVSHRLPLMLIQHEALPK